jgi:hypothetical protein
MRKRGAETATTQMGPMGAEDPSIPPSASSQKVDDLGEHIARAAVNHDLGKRVEPGRLGVDDD